MIGVSSLQVQLSDCCLVDLANPVGHIHQSESEFGMEIDRGSELGLEDRETTHMACSEIIDR